MTYEDIQNFICKKLSKNFENSEIIVEKNNEEIIENSFYVNLRTVKSYNFNKYIQNKLINVDIYYFNSKNTHLENLKMCEKLEYIFKNVKVKNNNLNIIDVTSKEVDDVLIVSFTLDYYLLTTDNSLPKMQELNFKERND